MVASLDKIYVFVKGHKGAGAFLIAGSDFKEIYKNIVPGQDEDWPKYMDLKAIEASLEYIKKSKGKDQIPAQPVICIYTNEENNYEIAAGLKGVDQTNKKMVQFKKNLNQLEKVFNKDRPQKDGVKYLWIPNNFEKQIENLKQLLLEHKKSTKHNP